MELSVRVALAKPSSSRVNTETAGAHGGAGLFRFAVPLVAPAGLAAALRGLGQRPWFSRARRIVLTPQPPQEVGKVVGKKEGLRTELHWVKLAICNRFVEPSAAHRKDVCSVFDAVHRF